MEDDALIKLAQSVPWDNSSEYTYSTVIWRIENLGFWDSLFHPGKIISPEFRLVNLNGLNSWTLALCPMVEDSEDGNFYFCLQACGLSENVSFVCEWSILDSTECAVLKRVELYQTTKDNRRHDIPQYPTYREVFVTRRASFLPNNTLTMKLLLCNVKGGLGQTEHISVVTQISAEKESFEWLIKDFSTIQLDEEIANAVTVGADLIGFRFALKGLSLDEAVAKISIVTKNFHSRHAELRIYLKSKDEKSCMKWHHTFDLVIQEHTWVLPKFLSRRELLESRLYGLSSDDLTLLCEMTLLPHSYLVRRIEKSYYGPESYLPDHLRNCVERDDDAPVTKSRMAVVTGGSDREDFASLAALSEDLRSLYSEKDLSDFELLSGDASFLVHKVVLSARSPVFKAMFCGDSAEGANPKSIDIPDLDVHTLGRLVSFLYSGTTEDSLEEWENAAKLYYAADKYQIPSLKRKCRSVLRRNVDVSNIPDILELADRHGDKELTSILLDFIQDQFDYVVLSEEWENFLKRSCLAGRIMREVYKRITDERKLVDDDE